MEQNRPYPVVFARPLVRQYGSTVQLIPQIDSAYNIKRHLPKRYGDVVDDDNIEEINMGRKNYKLIYKGKAGSAYIINMEL